MRAVILMFDTLTRKYLPNYGNDWVHAPNFKRLGEKTITFDNFYAGSMPCMPARREIHTGRYNFLHRSWGQLEPFDNSIFEHLKNNNIYTHLTTDHWHYWEDGGGTYHTRYNTWEGYRGQEYDQWIPAAYGKNHDQPHENGLNTSFDPSTTEEKWNFLKYGKSNLAHLTQEDTSYSSVQTMLSGIDFLKGHKELDNWLLQIECFDPHEPFVMPQKYRDIYGATYTDNIPNWPKYSHYDEEKESENVKKLQIEYAALISMIDEYLGKILDYFDENDLWKDTMLIVNTDHGFLTGEHNFVGKSSSPWYDELIHTPFFLHIPEFANMDGKRFDKLCQTIDIAPTILEYFNMKDDFDRDGNSIYEALRKDKNNHKEILFGINGGHVNIYDGKYVYMKAAKDEKNSPNTQYTLNFNFMKGFLPDIFLNDMQYVKGTRFSNWMPMMKFNLDIPLLSANSFKYGNLLFDLENDPNQLNPLKDKKIEQMMIEKMVKKMKTVDAPLETYQRIGLDKEASKIA
ncbi:sulfatase [Spiroplasma cantharicola]|uniref:Sulfatase N-terminal domain-containing protein n=1 Tax=Spiroplasma cantharicola TaxID=362837 RepID=A0A0M4JSS5_9MOLU|nr:sulfatase [Spiroplasma cantharicola]ALD66483.1 hypothetical protein SCANT_v1c05770 [Spiroplasma cantharicola]